MTRRSLRPLALAGLVLGAIGGCTGATDPAELLVDATETSGITGSFATTSSGSGSELAGAVWADFNGDDALDLYLTTAIGPNLLFDGVGDGTFAGSIWTEDVSLNEVRSGRASAADYDNDGLADLLVETDSGLRLFRSLGVDGFADVTTSVLPGEPAQPTAVAWADHDTDGFSDLAVGTAAGSVDLWHNENGTRFAPATEGSRVGIGVHALAWFDADGNGSLDLYVVGDVGQPNVLLLHDAERLEAAESGAGADVTSGAGGVTIGDVNSDAQADLVLGGVDGLVLLVNDRGTFENQTGEADLDGLGGLTGVIAVDISDDGIIDLYATGAGHNQVILGTGPGRFADRGPGPLRADTRGAATADVFGRGRADFVTSNAGSPDLLWRNTTDSGNRLEVEVTGAGPIAADAIGTLVTISADSGSVWTAYPGLGPATGSGNAPAQHIGLGAADQVDIEIVWPDGSTESHSDVPANTAWSLQFGSGPETAPLD